MNSIFLNVSLFFNKKIKHDLFYCYTSNINMYVCNTYFEIIEWLNVFLNATSEKTLYK